jgi:hypothetical protein
MLSSVPATCAHSPAKNRFAIQFQCNHHFIKMRSSESKHFEEQILIEGLHTLRWVERPNIFLGHPVVQGLNTERASYYAKELSPTNGRTASLPDKNKTL